MEAWAGVTLGASAVVAKTPSVSSGLTHMVRAMSVMVDLRVERDPGTLPSLRLGQVALESKELMGGIGFFFSMSL